MSGGLFRPASRWLWYRVLVWSLGLVLGTGLEGCGETGVALRTDAAAEPPDAGTDSTPRADVSTDAGARASVSVWTFNLLRPTNPTSTSSDVAKRTQMVIDAIIAEKPDLVALQEVVHSAAVPNRAKLIADATGYSWAYHQEYSAVVYEEGIGILSRWPILETEVVDLPHVDMFISTRRVLRARVGRPEGPIDFYCTHMIAFSLDDASADQALAAYQFITARKGGLPAMFAGDLNAEPSTLPMKFLRGETSYKNVTGNFVDSWLVTRANDPGYTSTSESPRNRIDYIYVVPSAQTSKPESCQLILDKPNDGTFASDHIGVACRILVH